MTLFAFERILHKRVCNYSMVSCELPPNSTYSFVGVYVNILIFVNIRLQHRHRNLEIT